MATTSRYRSYSNSNSSSDNESDDSDKECLSWKRASKRKIEESCENEDQEMVSESEPNTKKKRNNIWSDILQDQLISEDLNSCLLKNKPVDFYDRGEESYDYRLKYTDKRFKSDVEVCEDENVESDRRSVSTLNSGQSSTFVPLNREEKETVKKINRVLNEKKVYLLCRIVKYLGSDKALSLLKMTEDIEENGGMMIKNHARRRTPGGVYIQLIKSDKNIPKETVDKIFEGEMNSIEMKKYFKELKQKKKQMKKSSSEPILEVKREEKLTDTLDELEKCKENMEVVMTETDSAISVPTTVKQLDSDLEDGEIGD